MRGFVFGGLLGLGVLAFLAGCGEAKTIEYYRKHIDEAKAMGEKCYKIEKAGRLEELNDTEYRDCSNANRAIWMGAIK